MPVRAGLTVSAPAITWSLIPSFGYGAPSVPEIRRAFVSLSQNSSSPVASKRHSPSAPCEASAPSPSAAIDGRADPSCHVLRNQSVGSRCSVAASGPRLCAVTRISRSSWSAFAYSTSTSK